MDLPARCAEALTRLWQAVLQERREPNTRDVDEHKLATRGGADAETGSLRTGKQVREPSGHPAVQRCTAPASDAW
jgi:hypothetical protein